MPEKTIATWDHAVGKRLTKDIFSSRGALLVPASTIITRDHTLLFNKHRIHLSDLDIEPIGPYVSKETFEHGGLINEAVLNVTRLFNDVRATNDIPLAQLREQVVPAVLKAASESTHLFKLFTALQAQDDYTYRHTVAVGVIAHLIGAWMKLNQHERLQLTTAALLHDVGNMLIPKDILGKPEKLTSEEYTLMKSHTVLGYDLLKRTFGVTHRQALVALQHHERMDGSGYPFGLKQDKIDLFSRIISVADVFHAMTSKRVYRDPEPFYEVLYQMEKDTFKGLDPAITRLFVEKIMHSLIGRSVILTDGSQGTILMIHVQDLTRPLIQTGQRFMDLSKQSSIHIQQIL